MVTKFDEPLFMGTRLGHHSVKAEERRKFVEWLATPPADRDPKTLAGIARQLGVATSTLKIWKNDVRFVAEVSNRLSRHVDLDVIPDVIRTLNAAATDVENPRHVMAAKTLFDFLKWNVERTEEHQDKDVRDLSDEELRDLMLQTLDELDERNVESASH